VLTASCPVRGRARGFTLTELLFGMALLAVLIGLGVPAFGGFLQNAKLGTRSRSFYTGLQLARSEAIRRNQPVELALTDTALSTANVENAAQTAVTGRNWMVRVQAGASCTVAASAPYQLIEAKSALEGGDLASLQVLASTAVISFDSTGASCNGAQRIDFSNPVGGLCVPAGPMRCWSIVVGAGGQVRLCDPTVTALGDTRHCSP
jgi:type IV fimbrial biogenesis protein FimT